MLIRVLRTMCWLRSLTVGDFVLMGAYFGQLMGPLNWLGTLYRVIQESFVNMENMFDLLDEPVEVADSPLAVELARPEGPEGGGMKLEFDNVSFAYDPEKPVLQVGCFARWEYSVLRTFPSWCRPAPPLRWWAAQGEGRAPWPSWWCACTTRPPAACVSAARTCGT
jgi:hypothetical protein